jgi:3-oxoacyl-[acyl-carrier protein] reductase
MEQPLSGLGFDFSGKVAVVTGASAGIGAATAGLFAQLGARVIGIDRVAPTVAIPDCSHIEVDVASFDAVGDCVGRILEQEETVYCLVNNAGISRDATVWSMTEQQWDEVLNVNLKGAFNFMHHLAPHFREVGGSKIVNVSSINGLRGKFGLSNYAAAKAGLIGLTKSVARELGRYGVNVNAVAPGLVLTALTRALPEKFIAEAQAETVLDRLATPNDVARVIAFLCSEAARHITGEVIKIDGGQYI